MLRLSGVLSVACYAASVGNEISLSIRRRCVFELTQGRTTNGTAAPVGPLYPRGLVALKHAGVFEAMLKMEAAGEGEGGKGGGKGGEGLDPLVHATRANMAPEVLGALIDYLATTGLVVIKGKQARLTTEGKALLEHEDALLETMRSYEPVLDAIEHLLARLKTASGAGVGGAAVHRKTESVAEAQAARYAGELFPAIEKVLKKHELKHLLDLQCGAGELLIFLAKRLRNVVGVGIGAEGFLVRQGNLAITKAGLDKRLIQVTADPIEAGIHTKSVFARIGITTQLWRSFDCVIATNLFAAPGCAMSQPMWPVPSKRFRRSPKIFRRRMCF